MPDEHPFTLRQIDQARGDLYAIADDLDFHQGSARARADAAGGGADGARRHLLLGGARHSVDGGLFGGTACERMTRPSREAERRRTVAEAALGWIREFGGVASFVEVLFAIQGHKMDYGSPELVRSVLDELAEKGELARLRDGKGVWYSVVSGSPRTSAGGDGR